jgi:cystine transport system substrate-binding protein
LYGAYLLLGKSGVKISVTQTGPGSSPVGQAPAAAPQAPAATPVGRGVKAAMRTGVLASMRQRGYMVVGHEDWESEPMYFTNAQNRNDGFEFQLTQQLARTMGIPEVRFVPCDYSCLPEKLVAGEIDLIVAGYIPDPAIRGVDWSESYLDFGLCLIVPSGSAVTEPMHLQGRPVGVYDDPVAIGWVKQNIPGATIRTYSGETGWFEALERREIEGLIYDYPFAAAEIRKHPRTKIVKFNLNSVHYSVGIPAANDDLLEEVNRSLRMVKESPGYADLVRGYLTYQSDDLTRPIQGRKTHTVRVGDTLGSIAAERFGSSSRWDRIWDLNRQRIPNPHLIYPGYVLLLPEG